MYKKRLAAIFLIVVIAVMGLAGCTEKYYNGSVAVLEVDDSEKAQLTDAANKLIKVLKTGTLDQLLGLLPSDHTEEQEGYLRSGWAQWEKILADNGQPGSSEVTDVFLYHYAGAVVAKISFQDKIYAADMLFTSKYNAVYLDFYEHAESVWKDLTLPEGVTEQTVVIGEGTQYPLEGVLTYPEGGSDLPAVLLVHGIGNNNRDEQAMNTYMFRDLAYMLAEKGIAVLRYDKRGRTYPKELSVTEPEELMVPYQTIDDAVLAAKLLKEQPMIDPEKVYIAGHDLGGVLAPRIDLEADFAGMIMLGAPAHRWNYVAYDQLVRYGFNGVENETMRFLKPMIKGEYEELEKKETYTEDELTSVYLYQYGYFWRDLLSYDYPAMAASSGKPVLVILG